MIGVRPDQYRDYPRCAGTRRTTLPGVRGIGPKTAATLLRELGSAQAAFDTWPAAASGSGRDRQRGARRLAADGARDAWNSTARS